MWVGSKSFHNESRLHICFRHRQTATLQITKCIWSQLFVLFVSRHTSVCHTLIVTAYLVMINTSLAFRHSTPRDDQFVKHYLSQNNSSRTTGHTLPATQWQVEVIKRGKSNCRFATFIHVPGKLLPEA